MADRWVLHRAGITNVYQYGDEILRFGGGRLLLRGVNGSGKSTAMNMLLPFLLEADTRRIDAAGEQSGVLRSWMLSGRDEQQPVGYLWIEFRRGDEYVTCGCGIRANRSTDRVTTWWFVTDRRPGVDLALVEARTPLSVDALRAALGANAVFAHDQRAGYRAEVRNRLFGGADLDQHLRLLHVVRNPRVGDRIDRELPTYLTDALPQLSEAALDDAAQPLEDLEEHRRNVEDLTRTAGALDALDAVYRTYARAELHRHAGDVVALADDHRARQRAEARSRTALAAAESDRDGARDAIDRYVADERRLRIEIETLKGRDAYQQGAELTDLRTHVADLDRQVATAIGEAADRAKRRVAAGEALVTARDDAEADLASLRDRLSDLGRLAVTAGLGVQAPDAPSVPTRRSGDGDPGGETDLPAGAVDVDPLRARLADVRAAAHARRQDVADVRSALDMVDRAVAALAVSERQVIDAEEAERGALQTFAEARAESARVVEEWVGVLGPTPAADRCGGDGPGHRRPPLPHDRRPAPGLGGGPPAPRTARRRQPWPRPPARPPVHGAAHAPGPRRTAGRGDGRPRRPRAGATCPACRRRPVRGAGRARPSGIGRLGAAPGRAAVGRRRPRCGPRGVARAVARRLDRRTDPRRWAAWPGPWRRGRAGPDGARRTRRARPTRRTRGRRTVAHRAGQPDRPRRPPLRLGARPRHRHPGRSRGHPGVGPPRGAADARDLWERAGAHLDLTSGPALTWRLPVATGSPLSPLVQHATALGLPVHLTQFALRCHPVEVPRGTDILVVENPRVVEAAAQLGVATAVVATNGNPSGAVRLLVDQLLTAGASLRYHGDMDAAGLAICGRMAALGLAPWRMGTADYHAALAAAGADGVELPVDPAAAPPTPWDPALQATFDQHRLVVHEERLLPVLLTR